MKKAKPKQPQLDLAEIAASLMQAQVSETMALTELRDALGSFGQREQGTRDLLDKLGAALRQAKA